MKRIVIACGLAIALAISGTIFMEDTMSAEVQPPPIKAFSIHFYSDGSVKVVDSGENELPDEAIKPPEGANEEDWIQVLSLERFHEWLASSRREAPLYLPHISVVGVAGSDVTWGVAVDGTGYVLPPRFYRVQ
jgi:hypothetical protein